MEQKKILIVDDEKDCLFTLATRLRSVGYKVIPAYDAVAAVMLTLRERPDLILLDIGLPAGNGIVVMQRISSMSFIAMTPIIIITASDSDETRKLAFENGAAAYFQKPYDFDKLLQAIQNTLESHHK